MRTRPLMLVALIGCLATGLAEAAGGANAATTAPTRTGRSSAAWPLPENEEFTRSYEALARRYGVKPPADDPRGGRAEHSYQVYAPPDYEPGRPFGLFVWISAGPDGGLPEHWTKVLDEHHLIWIGPDGVGNDKHVLWRTYMALEAVRQARLHYTIDDERVYVSGISGGGRVASHAGIVAADSFTGGFYVVGCNFWKHVPTGEGKRMYAGFWRKPDPRILKKARAENRYVLLTGSEDFNRDNTEAIYDGYVKDKFAHVTYLEVPGMGHTLPDASWFEKGVEALDETLVPPAELFEQAAALEKRKQLGEACLAYGRAAVRGAAEPFAAEAGERSDTLRKGYEEQVERVRALIKDGRGPKAAAENAVLKQRYGPMAEQQVKAFADELKRPKPKR